MLETFHVDTFAELLHTKFRIQLAPDRRLELELVRAADLGSTPRQERFTIVFQGPSDIFLPQQMYHVEHDALGAFNLFLVPIGREPEGLIYEAVFNRLVNGS